MCRRGALPSVRIMTNTKNAVITGASRGLGLALARGLAADGWSLVIDARDGDALRAAAAGLLPAAAVTVLPGDITDPAHREAIARAAADLGGPDLLINNAGTLGASPLPAVADYPIAELRDAFEVNVLAPIALTQLLLPALRRRGGAVLSVTSDAAVEPYAGWGGYGAAKAALEQASNVLAAEENLLRVWWVDPGDLRTRMHQQAYPGEDISDRPLPEAAVGAFRKLIAERLPSGRYRAAELMPSAALSLSVVPEARQTSTVPEARQTSTVPEARQTSTVPEARQTSTVPEARK
jgi:NAD(P)-dependent dehydrogenase (short-subunit alcohol dehydrogenase family)